MALPPIPKPLVAWKHVANVAGLLLLCAPLHAEFVPQSFRNTTAPDWNIIGDAVLTAEEDIDDDGDGWLRLTENTFNQEGQALYEGSFASTDGIVLNFDYVMWNKPEGGGAADGISVFLFDPNVPIPMQGATAGAGLGYCNGIGGVLGIGLDSAAGNFANQPGDGFFCRTGLDRRYPNSITVRGPYITDGGTVVSGNPIVDAPYTYPDDDLIYNPFATTRPEQTRSVRLSLVPLSNGGYFVDVYEGPTGEQPNLIISGDYTEELPDVLSIGFAGSTGLGTQVNEVRLNSVSKPINLRLTTTPPVQSGPNGYTVTHTFTLENQPLVDGGAAVPITNPQDAPWLSEVYPPDLSNIRWTCEPVGADTTCPAASGQGPIENLGNYTVGTEGKLVFTVVGTVRCATDTEQQHTVTATFPSTSSYEDSNPINNTVTAKGPVTTESCPLTPQPVPSLGHLSMLLLSLMAAAFGVFGLNRRTTKA